MCGRPIVDWFPSSNANLELLETCMFCIDGCDWLTVLLGRNADNRKSNNSLYGSRANSTYVNTAIVQKLARVLIFSHWGYLDQFTI